MAPDLGLTLLHDPSAATRLSLPDVPRIACSVSPFSIQQQWTVPRTLRQARARLYHSPYYLMPYLPGVPSLVTCYDLIPLLYPEYFTATQRLIYRLAHGLALRTARVILAISQATKPTWCASFTLTRSESSSRRWRPAQLCAACIAQIDAVRQSMRCPSSMCYTWAATSPTRICRAWFRRGKWQSGLKSQTSNW